MARPTAFMPLWIGDYLADTTHLTPEQHGAYLLLLMAYWRRGGPLAADDAYLCRIVGMTVYKWRGTRPTIAAFFEERDGVWISKRSDEELVKAEVRYGKRAAAGRKGGSAPKVGGRKIVYAPALAASSASTIAANEAAKVETAETSHSEQSNASAVLEAGLKQSQSQPLSMETRTTVGSNHDNQNLAEPLLVRAEPEPTVKPASKPISSKRQTGTRWPAGQPVPDDWLAKAAANWATRGLPVELIPIEAEKFVAHWTAKAGKDAAKVDWSAAWRTWYLNAYGVKANGRSNGHATANGQSRSAVFDDAFDSYVSARAEREVARH